MPQLLPMPAVPGPSDSIRAAIGDGVNQHFTRVVINHEVNDGFRAYRDGAQARGDFIADADRVCSLQRGACGFDSEPCARPPRARYGRGTCGSLGQGYARRKCGTISSRLRSADRDDGATGGSECVI